MQMVGRGVHSGAANSLPHHDDRTLRLAAANSVAEAEEEAARCCAKLMNNPKSLHTLWNEWETGIGRNKPAKLFNHKEKGRDRSRYSKRLVFWTKISEMIRAGWTSTDAINKVINHYGTNLSITKIMLAMQKDRHRKTYPAILETLPS